MIKIIGFEKIKEKFINLNKKNLIPTKIIFSGNEGIGKFLLAKDFANSIYCNQIKKKNSNLNPNLLIIEKDKDKKFIEISKIREMIKYINHSSFNNDKRIILIRDVETLNINSTNALLKSLEEPNFGVYFILTYNNEKYLFDTLKSRCIEFKLKIDLNNIKEIVNNNFNDNIYNSLSDDFKIPYLTPSFLINLIKFFNFNNYNIDIDAEKFLKIILKEKYILSDIFIRKYFILFIQLFFYKKLKNNINYYYDMKKYFLKKLHNLDKYNLDLETFCIEFEDKLLNE
tara:strand:+ start:228 stop:1082 length:855 start_codon:yes stop_codon:yes gene_type:complete